MLVFFLRPFYMEKEPDIVDFEDGNQGVKSCETLYCIPCDTVFDHLSNFGFKSLETLVKSHKTSKLTELSNFNMETTYSLHENGFNFSAENFYVGVYLCLLIPHSMSLFFVFFFLQLREVSFLSCLLCLYSTAYLLKNYGII